MFKLSKTFFLKERKKNGNVYISLTFHSTKVSIFTYRLYGGDGETVKRCIPTNNNQYTVTGSHGVNIINQQNPHHQNCKNKSI